MWKCWRNGAAGQSMCLSQWGWTGHGRIFPFFFHPIFLPSCSLSHSLLSQLSGLAWGAVQVDFFSFFSLCFCWKWLNFRARWDGWRRSRYPTGCHWTQAWFCCFSGRWFSRLRIKFIWICFLFGKMRYENSSRAPFSGRGRNLNPICCGFFFSCMWFLCKEWTGCGFLGIDCRTVGLVAFLYHKEPGWATEMGKEFLRS